jgi:hypothetical protein
MAWGARPRPIFSWRGRGFGYERMRRERGRPLVFAAVVWSDIENRLANRKAARVNIDQTSGEAIVGTEDHGIQVRTSPSSSPTPLLKTTQSPLSCARDGNQRTSHSRPWVPEAPLRSPRVLVRADPIALDRSEPVAWGLRELQPPVSCGANNISGLSAMPFS